MPLKERRIPQLPSHDSPEVRWGEGTWRTKDEGAYRYSYSEGRSFLRVLKQGKVLGAIWDGEVWVSAQGPIGAIPDVPRTYMAPQGAKGVGLVTTSGAISAQVYVFATDFDREHPTFTLAAETGCSGPMRMAVFRFEPEMSCQAEQLGP